MATNLNFRTSGPYTLNTGDSVKSAGLTNADIDNNFYTVQQKKFDNHGYVTGDIFYANASGNVVRLAKATDGQVLKLTGGFPSWGNHTYTLDGNQNSFNNISAQLLLNGTTIDSIDFVGANGSFVFWDEANQKITIESGYSQSLQQVFTTAVTNQSAFTDVGSTGQITIFRPNTDPQYVLISQIQTGDKIEVTGLSGIAAPNNKFYEVLGVSIISENEIRITVDDANLVNVTSGTTGNTPTIRHSKRLFVGNKWNGDLEVTGNLIIQGDVTTVNTSTLLVEDKNIELGVVASPTNTTADGGGITLKGATNKTFNWVNATGAWTSSEHLALASGKSLFLNGSTSGTTTVNPAATGSPTLTLPGTTGTIALTSNIGDGTLSIATKTAGATNTDVTLNLSGAYSANTTTNRTVNAVVGPALTNLASTMTGAGAGFLKKTAQDTYAVDTNTYLTTNSNDFGTFAINGTDSGYTWGTANANTNQVADAVGDTLTLVKGDGINLYTNTVAGTDAIKIEHADTSSVANLTASGRRYVTGLTFDTYGHVTAYTTGTETSAATDELQNIANNTANTEQYITFVANATGAQTGGSNASIRVNPSTATISATNFNSTSDIRFKKDLEVITGALDKVMQLTGYTFTMIESNQRSSGLIAQDLEKVLPEAIGGEESKKTLNYGATIGLIVEALKELNSKVDKLQKHLEDK